MKGAISPVAGVKGAASPVAGLQDMAAGWWRQGEVVDLMPGVCRQRRKFFAAVAVRRRWRWELGKAACAIYYGGGRRLQLELDAKVGEGFFS